MVAQNGAVLIDDEASSNRQCDGKHHDHDGTEPTSQFQ